MKINLLNYTLPKLEQFFVEIGEKKFRAKQVFRWLHVYGAANFAEMTDIAKSLRAKLEEIAIIEAPELVTEHISSDGTCKWVLSVNGSNKIEAVFIPEDGRGTLCVSSQVGCALECQFCSTGRQGFNRNLTPGEIIGQLWWANKRLGKDPKGEKIITNVVMMGMGEPLQNYTALVPALNTMLSDHAYGLSRRRVTVSTSGVVPMIERLGKDCPVALAVSLHAPTDALRSQLVPLNKKYPLSQLLGACKSYLADRKSVV